MIPILYESGVISIQTLWVFTVLAVLVASYLAVERLKRSRVNFTLLIEHSTFILIWGVIGARILFFFTHTDTYLPALDLRTLSNLISIWDQGLSLWGALIGAGLTLFYKLRKSGENLSKWADALIVPILVGISIGNIGAFLGGYSYGHPTDLPWGVLYESFNVKYTIPVHPVQLYEFTLISLLLICKRKLGKKIKFFEKEGNAALYFVTNYSLICFFLEFLRGDDTLRVLGVRLDQIGFFFLSLIFGFLLWKRIKQHSSHGSPETL